MKILVRYVTRRPRGNTVNRDELVEATELGIGRGAGNALHLSDIRIQYNHAVIHPAGPGHATIQALGDADLAVNGKPVRTAEVSPGDEIDVGPYRLRLLEPGEGHEVGVSAELVAPQSDDEERVRACARTSFAREMPGRRPIAWALVSAVLVLFLALPLYSFLAERPTVTSDAGLDPARMEAMHQRIAFDTVWTSGAISGPHRFTAENCTACHQDAFVMVRDSSCTACHQDIGHHADPAVAALVGGLAETRCATCHKEHEGPQAAVQDDQRSCTTCHANLKAEHPKTGLQDVWAFDPGKHPQFRPSVVTDGATGKVERLEVGGQVPLVERSNLVFPHSRHLKAEGIRGPDGTVKMQCSDCHTPSGGLFQPVSMEKNCQSCHAIKFDPASPARTVPHVAAEKALEVVRDHFNSIVLSGNYDDVTAPAVVRRRPGTEMKPEERAQALQWAAVKTGEAIDRLAGKSGCGGCHVVTKAGEGATATLAVAKLHVTDRWMPKGIFDHPSHDTMSCDSCHAAKTSQVATDVLLPGVQTCTACHGPQEAAAKVPSTCVTCHVFHQPGLPAMRPGPDGKTAAHPAPALAPTPASASR